MDQVSGAFAPQRAAAKLRIMATTDLHGQILPYDYFLDRPTPPGGLAVLASLVRGLRRDGGLSLLLDNGDFLQGNSLADWAAGPGAHRPHPVIAAMNALGYDAATLGNHEFNYGLEILDKAMAEAEFPFALANVTRRDRPLAPPWVILDRMIRDDGGQDWPLRIGVIGLAPPQIAQWERMTLGNRIAATDILAAARRHLPDLRAAGAEIVVALCHSGIGAADHEEGMENAAVPLARVPGIDALILGHTHGVFPGRGLPMTSGVDPLAGTLAGKPAVMAGAMGSHLGVIDLHLERKPRGEGWRILHHVTRVIPAGGPETPDLPTPAPQEMQMLSAAALALREAPLRRFAPVPDAKIVALTEESHGLVLDVIRRDIGTTLRRIDNHFALIRADDSLQIVADAQEDYARAALAGTEWEELPLLSAVAPFRAGGRAGPGGYLDIPAGALSFRNAAELYIYPNKVCVIKTTGARIHDWLEQSALLFQTVQRGVLDQPLIDPAVPSYNFDVLFGVTYRIDPSRPAGARISDLRWRGQHLDPGARVAVVTNSYRAGGAGGFAAALAGARVIDRSQQTVRDLVIALLHRARPRPARPVWRFVPLPGTGAWFDTAPAARGGAAPGRVLEDLGLRPDGFRRFRLRFDG